MRNKNSQTNYFDEVYFILNEIYTFNRSGKSSSSLHKPKKYRDHLGFTIRLDKTCWTLYFDPKYESKGKVLIFCVTFLMYSVFMSIYELTYHVDCITTLYQTQL